MQTYTLPLPTSTNRNTRAVGGRIILSKAYREWIQAAGWELQAQRPTPIKGKVELQITIGKSRKDLSNHVKPIEDLLVRHNVIEGDGPQYVRHIVMSIDEAVEGCRVTVRPYAATAAEALWG